VRGYLKRWFWSLLPNQGSVADKNCDSGWIVYPYPNDFINPLDQQLSTLCTLLEIAVDRKQTDKSTHIYAFARYGRWVWISALPRQCEAAPRSAFGVHRADRTARACDDLVSMDAGGRIPRHSKVDVHYPGDRQDRIRPHCREEGRHRYGQAAQHLLFPKRAHPIPTSSFERQLQDLSATRSHHVHSVLAFVIYCIFCLTLSS